MRRIGGDRRLYLRRGQSSVEYALIIGLIAVLVIMLLALLGGGLTSVYCSVVGVFRASPPQCGGGGAYLLQEPFNSLSGWNFTVGSGWQLQNGQLVVTQSGEQRGFTGSTSWTDYTVQVQQANLQQGNGYGIYFRITNEPAINGYVFQYDPGYNAYLIRKVVNGNESPPLAVAAVPAQFQWTNVTRSVKIDVRGSTFTASIDGVKVLQAQDTQFTSGRVGLRSWDDSRATFDNLTVTS